MEDHGVTFLSLRTPLVKRTSPFCPSKTVKCSEQASGVNDVR